MQDAALKIARVKRMGGRGGAETLSPRVTSLRLSLSLSLACMYTVSDAKREQQLQQQQQQPLLCVGLNEKQQVDRRQYVLTMNAAGDRGARAGPPAAARTLNASESPVRESKRTQTTPPVAQDASFLTPKISATFDQGHSPPPTESCRTTPPRSRRVSSCSRHQTRENAFDRLPSIEDRGQTDSVTTPTRAELRRCSWPRSRHAAPLTALVRS